MVNGKLSKRKAAIADMLSDGKQVLNFYRFAAQNPEFDLYDACQIIVTRPNASVCFSIEEWNAMGRRVTKGRKGIPYVDRDGQKHFVFDASDTHGEERYKRLIYPMRRILIGLDKINGTERAGDTLSDYIKIQAGVEQYLQENGYVTDDKTRNRILIEGVAYSLYCKSGFPKNNGVKLHGFPYGLRENANLFKDVFVLTEVVKEEIEDAYLTAQEEVPVINDIDEETVSDEPVIHHEPQAEPEIVKASEKAKEEMHVSPYYQRFLTAQEENPDSVIAQRLGDFYEIMGDTAVHLAERLDLTLTSRDVGLEERIPMIGFPYHAAETYFDKILEEQSVIIVEDGKEPVKILSHREIRGEKEVEQTEKPRLIEMEYGPTPFDDEEDTSEEQPGYVDGMDTRFPVDDDYEEDYDKDETNEKDEAKVQPQEKKQGKPLSERKRKNKPKQYSLFDIMETEESKKDYQSLVEELIEKELKSGSRVEEGKFRICDEYSKNPTEQEFATFLKKEYGVGGHGDGEYDEMHDGRGIRMVRKNPDTHETVAQADLNWNQAALKIADLIDDDNYLTASEKEEYENYRAQRYGTDESRITAIATSMVSRGTRYTWNGAYNYWGFGDLYRFVLERSAALKEELEQRSEVESVTVNGADFNVTFHREFCRHLKDEAEPEEIAEKQSSEPEREESANTNLSEIGFDQSELGGAKARFKSNIEAIETVKKLYRENRDATPEERKVLAKYVGWGGLAKAFDETDANWKKEYAQLKGLLTEDEYNGAKGSVLNAHYTAKEVIDGMYFALQRFGVKGNNRILEPALGTGNFFGYMPKEIAEGAKLYGVELDSLTGRIASKLYPQANVQIKGFEQTTFSDDSFDVVLSNVPFGAYSVYDSAYSRNNFYVHDYFIAKSLDKLKPNGVMAVITSKGTMDKLNPSVRKYFADRAELLGAIRLPNTAFKTTANTEVVADVLFFRKREERINAEVQNCEWLATGKTEQGYEINKYFIMHPEMVLGTLAEERGLYGASDVTVNPDGRDLSEALHEAVERLPSDFYVNPEKTATIDSKAEIEVDYNVKPLCYKVVGNKLYMRVGETMEEREVPNRPQDAFQRISGMIELRKTIREILDMEIAGCSNAQLGLAQKQLNDKYDRFVRNYGILNSQTNVRLFREDADSSLLFACENLSDDKKTATKADMFYARTIRPYVVPTQTDDCFEALQISMNERGKVDIEYVEELTKKDYNTVLDELGDAVFKNPAETSIDDKYSGFETAEKYLSGNVKRKLSMAKTFARELPGKGFERNVKALESVQPEPLSASDISVRIGASWIDKDYYKQFLMKILGIPFFYEDGISVYYNPHDSSWRIDKSAHLRNYSDMKVHEVYGTGRASAYRIFEDCLNLKATTIYDTVEEDGKEKRVLNQAETIAAREKQNKIKEEFKDWIFEKPERRDDLVTRYNELFNQIRLPTYDGSYLKFPEMNPTIELRPHQRNAVQRIVTGENTLLHHVVGAGKTYTICASCMKLRQYGLAKKPMIVVPNHLVQQWAGEFRLLYPNAKLLIAGKEDLEKSNRKRFVSKVALGDWDAVIIAQSSFAKIPISSERQEKKLQEEIRRIEETIASQWEENSHPRGAVKNLERIKKNREAQLKKLMDDAKKDDVLIFENLGVDYLFVDEAHNYKNLFLFTKMNNVAGISASASQRATDLKLKCEFINELHGGDKGIVFATGTPISNSMTEMYTMQSYLGSETLRNLGINFFDSWAADFGETITSLEMAPSGQGYKAKTRFAKFTNLPELLTLYRSFADVQTAEMVKLDVPEADKEVINLKPSDTVIDLAEEIAERAEKISLGGVPPEIDNMLKITSDGKKLALDPRCFEPTASDEETSKLNACADRIYEIWKDTTEVKGTQIVFCDLSTPKKAFEDYEYGKDFDAYNELKYKLVQKGIPASEIAYIHEANSDNQKQALFDNVNDGKVRVLLGSTEKCGAGTNVQKRLVALHHLDTPYRPSDMEQREGRIVRQGNENERVKIFTYVTERTFDSYSYQILENKQRFISQINKGDLTVREAEDIDETTLSYAEIKAITAANPKIKRKMEVDTEVARLRVLEGQYKKNLYGLQDKLRKTFPEDIRRQELFIERTKADIKVVEENFNPDDFVINVNGVTYTDRKEGGRALTEALYASKPETVVAEYAGFKISMNPIVLLTEERSICLSCNGQHNVDVGQSASGNLMRIENFLMELPSRKERLLTKLEQLKRDMAIAEEEVKKPFQHAERLAALLKEQTELNAELDLNKREEVIISDDKDEGENYMALPEKDDIAKPIDRNEQFKNTGEEVANMEIAIQPDYSVDQKDMEKYGYYGRGMLPLRKESATRLYKLGLPVHRLHGDDTEYSISKPEDFHNERIFGIKKTDWKAFIESATGKTYLATRLEICKAAEEVVSQDLEYVDETFTIDFIESNYVEKSELKNYVNGFKPDKRYVPDLTDEFTDRIYDDALKHYGWVKADIPRTIMNRIDNAELKDETANYVKQNETDAMLEEVMKDMNTNEFREFAGLEPINYKERVKALVIDEFKKFQSDTLEKSPEEIFRTNYEIHVKTELLDTIDGDGLEDEYYQALYQEKDNGILQQLYDDFTGNEYASVNTGTDTMEFIRDYCKRYYEDVLKSAREQETDANVKFFGKDTLDTAYYYFNDKLGMDYDEPRITDEARRYIIAAPVCYLSQEYLDEHNIVFLKTGRDIDESQLIKGSDYGRREIMKKAYYLKLPVEAVEANEACKIDVESYIRENFDGMRLNTNRISDLVDYYGEERLNYVLANTVQLSEEDGRYSPDNKQWAKDIAIRNDENERRKFGINSHPAVLDGFITLYRKRQKEKNLFEIDTYYGGKTKVRATVELYNIKEPLENRDMHGLAIRLVEETGEPFAVLTTSFSEFIERKNAAYVDVNNCPFAPQFLKQGIAVDTGLTRRSGYVDYPLWQFNEEFLKSIGGENYKTYSQEWDKYTADTEKQNNKKEEDYIMPENEKKTNWIIVKVSHDACISEQEKHLFMKMPNGGEYRGYTYNVFKSRVKESSQLVDLQSESSELCYELLFRDNEYVVLHKGDDEVELSAQEFKELVNGTSDKDYVREEPKARVSFSFSGDNVKGTYEKSSLIVIPENLEYAGYGFYLPNAFIEEDKSREDGYIKMTLPEDLAITLKNKERTEEIQATAKELKDVFDGKKVGLKATKTEPVKAEQSDDKKNGWKYVYVPVETFIQDYEKSNLMRMPEGKYSGFVFYFPKLLTEETERGDFKLNLPPDFSVRLKNNKDGAEQDLSVDEFIEEVKDKKVESYQKPSETKSDKFAERKKVLDEAVPRSMKEKPNWVIVRIKDNEEKGRPDKFLIDCHTGKFARSDDPETWTDYETACKYASENGGVTLAYALDGKDKLACIDLDHCIDENGNYSDLAKELLAKCGKTYTETSVSGKGLHIFGTTEGMNVRTFAKDGDMEFYQKSHFISMTGDGAKYKEFDSFDKAEMKDLIEKKCEKRSIWRGVGEGVEGLSKMSDRDVVEKACKAKHGDTFKALYEGKDLQNNRSNSDMSLMNRLAFWCNGDKEQMLRIFATSGLFRPEKSPDYYEGTAIKAIKDTSGRFHQNPQSTYTPKPPVSASGNSKN